MIDRTMLIRRATRLSAVLLLVAVRPGQCGELEMWPHRDDAALRPADADEVEALLHVLQAESRQSLLAHEALQQELSAAQAAHQQLRQTTASRIDSLEQRIRQLQQTSRDERAQAQAVAERLRHERLLATTATSNTLAQLHDAIGERDSLKAEGDGLRLKLQDAEALLQRMRTEIERLRQQQAETRKQLAALNRRNLALQEAVAQRDDALAEQRRQWLHEVRNLYRIGRDEAAVRQRNAIREVITNPFNPALAWSLTDVALLLAAEGGLEEAETLLRRALLILESDPGPRPVAAGTVRQHLAELRWRQGDLEAAATFYADAVDVFEASLGRRHPRLATTLNDWAALLQAQGRPEAAEAVYRHCLDLYASRRLRDNPDVAAPLHNLGRLLTAENRFDEAEALLLRAKQVLERNPAASPAQQAQIRQSLSSLYTKNGDPEKADLYARAAAQARTEP